MGLLKEGRNVSRDAERVLGSDNECFMGQSASCVLAMEHLAVFLDSRCIDNGEAINLNLNNFSTAIRFCSKARQ